MSNSTTQGPNLSAGDLDALLGGGNHQTPFDWREYYHAIRDRVWIPILCLVVALIAAIIYLVNSKPSYTSRSVLFMEKEGSKVLDGMQDIRDYEIRSVDMIMTIVDMLGSKTFAQRTAERLSINQNPEFLSATKLKGHEITPAQAGNIAQKMIVVKFRDSTRLIDITATTRDPKLSIWLANSWAEEYIKYLIEKRNDAAFEANKFLLDEAARLRKKLRTSEEAMQSFREREKTASFESLMSEAQKQLDATNQRMADLEKQIFQITTDLNIAATAPDNLETLLRLPSVAAEPNVAKRSEAVTALSTELSLVSQRYRAKHPAYISVNSRLGLAKSDQADAVSRAVALLESTRSGFQTQLSQLSEAQKEQQTRLLKITGTSIEFNDLQRELETDKSLYDAIVSRIKEVDVTKGLEDLSVQIHERATGANKIVPNTPMTLSIACFGGLALGMGIALGLHLLDNSYKTVEQLENGTGQSCFTAIPKIKTDRAQRNIPSLTDHSGLVAEAFRTLRASVGVNVGPNKRTFLFTSSYPSEGKTFCSCNFAVTLALQGHRTALVDVDLRKPDVCKSFFGAHRRPGLAEILLGKVGIEETYQKTENENLIIIPAGERLSNPAEVLSTADIPALIERLLEKFDRIVFDTAPLLAVSDTLLLAGHVEVALLVVRASSTARNAVRRSISQLDGAHASLAGVVMNQLPHGRGGYYSYYYSHGQYGSYGTENYGEKETVHS